MVSVAHAQGPVSQFQEIQSVPTSGAVDWEYFAIGSDHYLALANHFNGTTYNLDSKIYRWDGVAFVEIQTIATNAATDWEYFMIGSDHYLAVANQYNDITYNVNSIIYRWDGTSFVPYQTIATNGARDWEYFMIGSDHYLALANGRNAPTSFNVNSIIYRWDGTSFVPYQTIATNWASDWKYFMIGTDHYLAVANGDNGTTHNIDSRIYRWDGTNFIEVQAIPTNAALDWEYFTIGGNHYLVVANWFNNVTGNIDSKIYQWDGTNFVEVQAIPTNRAVDWEYFTIDNNHYLVVANANDGATVNIDSRIYQWNGTNFVQFQTIPTSSAHGWEFFAIGTDYCLAVANQRNDSTFNVDSKIYRATFPEIDVLDNSISIPDETGLVSFGSTTVGTPITKTFTVQNLGTADLTLTPPITLPLGFSVVNSFGSTTVISATSTTFEIQLDATAIGVFSGTLAFDNNDYDENPYNFVISGTVAPPPTPGYGSTPGVGSTINVGSVVISNTTSANLTVQETGTAQLDVGVPGGGLLSGANASDFTIVNGPPFSIVDGGAKQVVTIQCTPSGTGLRTATLSFTTNDSAQPSVNYTLNCTGTAVPTPVPPTNNNNDDDDDDDGDGGSSASPPAQDLVVDCWPWQVIVPALTVPGAKVECIPMFGEALPAPSVLRHLEHSAEITVRDAAGVAVHQFNPALKVCFHYTEAELTAVGGEANDFQLQTYREDSWESLETRVEGSPSGAVQGRVCAPVDHLTLFGLFGDKTGGEGPAESHLAEVKYLPETGLPPHNLRLGIIGGGVVVLTALIVSFGVLVWRRRRYDD